MHRKCYAVGRRSAEGDFNTYLFKKDKAMKRVLARQVGRELSKDEHKKVGGGLGEMLTVSCWIESEIETESSYGGGPASDCDVSSDFRSDT